MSRRLTNRDLGQAMARRVLHSLAAVPDIGLRQKVIAEFCAQTPPPQVATALHVILRKAVTGADRAPWMALMLALETIPLSYGAVEAIYRGAVDEGYEALRMMFMVRDQPMRAARGSEFPQDDTASGMTLGARRWKARSPDRAVLERLFFDPDPEVLRHILGNPRLTETQVLRIASRRPNRVSALNIIAVDSRWVSRPRVQQALVLNPYNSARLSARIAPLLPPKDWGDIARDGVLDPGLRAIAQALSRLRAARPERVH